MSESSNVAIIVQARMSSSRLPGKVLKELCGKALIEHVVERASRSKFANHVILATSNEASDDALAEYCQLKRIECHRGSLEDVLARFIGAAKQVNAQTIVRITGDCPLIDPEIIDKVIMAFTTQEADYASNVLSRKYPRGLDVEVVSFKVLENIHGLELKQHHREHVTPYIYENKGLYKMVSVEAEGEFDHPHWRWCVDEPSDFEFIKALMEGVYFRKPEFNAEDLLEYIKQNPELPKINEQVAQKALH
jgi:spore coat polysaccharide biosynthesis protein SpsF